MKSSYLIPKVVTYFLDSLIGKTATKLNITRAVIVIAALVDDLEKLKKVKNPVALSRWV